MMMMLVEDSKDILDTHIDTVNRRKKTLILYSNHPFEIKVSIRKGGTLNSLVCALFDVMRIFSSIHCTFSEGQY